MNVLPILQNEPRARSCGDCSMCCKLLHIKELSKPAGVWCEHCKPGSGCTAYADRPQVCHDFECMWLQEVDMPDELRPDKSHCILWVNETGEILYVSVDPQHPDAWKQGKMRELVHVMYTRAQNPKIGITVGKEKFAYDPLLISDDEFLKEIDYV